MTREFTFMVLLRLIVLIAAIAHVGDVDLSTVRSDVLPPAALPLPARGPAFAPEKLRAALATAITEQRAHLSRAEAQDFARAYEQSEGAPLWIDAGGGFTDRAREAQALIEHAGSEGLDPNDYETSRIAGLVGSLDDGSVAEAARIDTLLTASVLRYFHHVHIGRIDPKTLGLQIAVTDEGHDFAALLRSAIDRVGIVETAAELSPKIAQYRLLKAALGRYRSLAERAGTSPAFSATLHPGDTFEDLPALHHLLVTLGDLDPDTPAPVAGGIYDDVMRAGVARFQARHGLDADGVIGRSTQAALQVPLTARVRQIEMALERLRWLPDLRDGRLIAVNIPMFRLWAWNQVPSDDPPDLTMDVIVGRALDTRTPVFADQMEYVVFRPYWNVPASILRNEMLPAIRRDAGYLQRQNLEIVRGPGDNSPVIEPTTENIASLGQGGVRIRQRPGPTNALGLVKFMFPNQNDVYMHDTPATQLFGRARRDLSHGCIRVEDPAGLAEWVLRDNAGWTRERINAAMNGSPNRRVDLSERIQVVIFYTTAVVQPENDSVHFAEDLYGHDARLDKVLSTTSF